MRAAMEKVLIAARLTVILPVALLLIAALGSFLYGTILFFLAVHSVVVHPLPAGHKIAQILVVIDLFLIGATLLIASFGLYELFVNRITAERESRLPAWLQMHDLNDLKARVISMIVLISAVEFIEVLVASSNGIYILERAGAVGLVIAALTAYVRLAGQSHDRG